MQFLQAGLDNDEHGPFVSTERTFEELHNSFSGVGGDPDHPDLAFATVHAGVERTFSPVDAAEQVLEAWLTDDGRQFISLDTSSCGFVGTTTLVEYSAEPPCVEVQEPPHDRDTPYARDPVSE